ncbi:phosphoglycerate dehydrogenase [Actinoplanes sp. SE50]|uniref:NAD(P)-dependent oxidoreductase n=1 Tax=unclassified Actinoplanes TaxID=2626549 RepID=UPI00023EC4D8|nr:MULTISPECIES: NAD(P)-dependent oxidoreductase [unclassified Actinoplanes]AEV86402.1 Erythronate-4-phosphate dehydrogenase [Actinoplanes sp. SE50/110]ATO84799.1 phosphoglycerate dehydrogenase [Actinoplanes sp. SE50]SLM02209.1 phosphoglycerate dehydrogenase [Actinoplanes sp. SE50/110]
MKVLLPDSVELDVTLPDGVIGVTYTPTAPIPGEHADADVLVVWGNTAAQLADAARRLTRLRWVQTLSAGPDAVLQAGFAPGVPITAGLGLHDQTVAEHTLALLLAAARRLNLLVRAQIGHRWAGELGGLQPVREEHSFRTLRDAHVVVWGFGGIAATLAPLLTALGARVTGVARTAGDRHGYPVVTAADLPQVLPTADVLVSILPAAADTAGVLDAGVLALFPPHAWVVNVGRGSTLDEAALLDALRAGRIAGAALDVFVTEPLPPASGLWDEPNVIITPHAAGGRPLGAARLIEENLAAFRDGRPLRNRVA